MTELVCEALLGERPGGDRLHRADRTREQIERGARRERRNQAVERHGEEQRGRRHQRELAGERERPVSDRAGRRP